MTGNPNMRCDLDLGKCGSVWGSVSGTAMRMVNLIPALAAASPGLHSAPDLPLVASTGLVAPGAADEGVLMAHRGASSA